MVNISIAIVNQEGKVKRGKFAYDKDVGPLIAEAQGFANLAMQDFKYEDGDQIKITLNQEETFLMVKLDATLDTTLIYVKGKEWCYTVNRNENTQKATPEYRFAGTSHYLSVREATSDEICAYRNIALNPHDQQKFNGAFPHAYANVETRDDATFFACNAIDGIFANLSHGDYPYGSWGINQQEDAAWTIDFGKDVIINRVKLTFRADFPHDNYWKQVTLTFSNGDSETFQTIKTSSGQQFEFSPRQVSTVTFHQLLKGEDPSPFPALTQIELFGMYDNKEGNKR